MKTLETLILKNPSLAGLPQMVEAGALPALVSGLGAIHRAQLAAALHVAVGRPVLVVCPDESAADTLVKDIGAILDMDVPLLQARDFIFYSVEGASRTYEQRRIAALDALASGTAKVCVATVSGLMQRTAAPDTLEKAAFTIRNTDAIAPEAVEEKLLQAGYVRTQQVEGPGQFSRRGGILDFFSPAYAEPVRLDFWGDEIDDISFFDADSQRRTEKIKVCRVLPAAEILPAAAAGGEAALAAKLEALAAALRKSTKYDSEKLRATLREEAQRLAGGLSLSAADRYIALIEPKKYTALEYVSPETLIVLSEPGKCLQRAQGYLEQLHMDVSLLIEQGTLSGKLADFARSWEETVAAIGEFPVVEADAFTVGRYPLEPRSIVSLTCRQLPSYGGSAETAAGDVSQYLRQGYAVVVFASDRRKADVLLHYFQERDIHAALDEALSELPPAGKCVVSVGHLTAGFEYPDIRLAVLTDAQFVRAGFRKNKRRRALSNRQRLESYADLTVGDLVVHEYHGIGRFSGIFKMPMDGVEKDYIKISYAGTDSLYVPATQLDLVSKYIGAGEDKPVRLSKMGGSDWKRVKSRAKAAAKEMAGELIQLYASRQKLPGYAFSPDSPWQTEFEERFEYIETEDQLRCIQEIKADMEKPHPMDRLLCGDVGYGKTEVALRAAMKCILDGKQAAILVPTTVLAQQHYQTAVQRFFGYPVNISVLSRFRTAAQMKQTLQDLKDGSVDLVIGTHRLLQKDVVFKDLGLLIVDEEQRFGVSHKEHIKEMSRQIDVLTLSATPIPRTLNMALSGIRDMSTLEEPPQNRMPVQTYVMEHDWDTVCDAIRREVQRGGQVYYLHNRVENIERTAMRLAKMLEGISVAVAHGQMDEESLSAVMESMSAGETQVLVCTTIIETGIDIPNVNTLIIEDADKLGLAQLHQLRGRVGRSNRRASAYLTFRKDKVLTEIAEKRLEAIREFAEFGSGFKIAMRDLEIRGAGNLLGAEQSGHMIDVGYDMYLKLLEEAVLEERGEKPPVRTECAADLAVSANIPERYVPSAEQRMDLYRRIALIRTEADADDLLDEIIDRFGEPPSGVNALIQVALLRGEASKAGIRDISQKAGDLRFTFVDFDLAAVTALYEKPEYKGRIKVEAGTEPRVRVRIQSKKRILDEARRFVADWQHTQG